MLNFVRQLKIQILTLRAFPESDVFIKPLKSQPFLIY
jgi:hypothetical protein